MPAAMALVALGLLPAPGDLEIVRDRHGYTAPGAIFLAIFTLAQLAALLPLAVVLPDAAAGRRLPSLAAKALGAAVIPVGAIATFASLLDAGGGSRIVLAKCAVLTFALSGALLWTARGRMAAPGRTMAWAMVAPAAVAGALSLAAVPVVLLSARSLADGAPYCLALHKTGPAPVGGYPGLRLFSFHTTLSGHKDYQAFFFHGLLVVGAEGGERIFNWSPRRMGFEEVRRPDGMTESPRGACAPGGGQGEGHEAGMQDG